MLITIPSNESMLDTVAIAKGRQGAEVAIDDRASPTDVQCNILQDSQVVSSSPVEQNLRSLPEFNPFFTMDWLDQVDPRAMKMVQQVLQTSKSQGELPKADLEEVRKDLFTPAKQQQITTTVTNSALLKRSIAIGNGYNAKGIEKARLGAWDEALSCWQDALEIRQQMLGDSHVDVANTCNNIGIALGKLQRPNDAVLYLERALEIRKLTYGEQHEQVAATLHNLGNVYQEDGDLQAAIQLFCECKLLQEKILGEDHAEVARACIAIGHTYYQADALEDAREAYMDALSIFYRTGLPEDEPEVQATLDDVHDLDRKILCSFCCT